MADYTKPPRVIGTLGATLINVNGMLGAGIFALPALLYSETGSFAPWMLLIFGGFYACFVLVASELSRMFKSSGGAQLYAQVAFGPLVGFQVGWLMVIACVAGRAATLHVLISYLAVFLPALEGAWERVAAILFLLAMLSALTLSGMRRAVGGVVLGTLLKVTPILLLCLFAFAKGGVSPSFEPPELGSFQSVALLVFFAYSGGNIATYSAGEVRDPQRTLPRSMLLALGVIVLFYMIVQWAYIAAGAPSSEGNATPLSAAAGVVMGPAGMVLLTLAAIFSITTNALAFFMTGPRIIFGMAERGLLPLGLGHVSPRFLTPDWAILLFTAMVACVSLSGRFEFLATVTSLSQQFVTLTMLTAFALFRLRGREGQVLGLSAKWWGILAVSAAFAVYASLQAPRAAYALVAVLIVLGAILSILARRRETTQPVPMLD